MVKSRLMKENRKIFTLKKDLTTLKKENKKKINRKTKIKMMG